MLGQVDEELATRRGPAGLDEAQVLGRDVRVQGQLELAEASSRAPEADQLARGLGLLLGLDDHPMQGSGRYMTGNRRAALPAGPLTTKRPHDRRRYPMTAAEKYVALWNEPEADRRRRMIAELWTEDGRHILQPPQEVREIAAQPGIAMSATLEARGYEQI